MMIARLRFTVVVMALVLPLVIASAAGANSPITSFSALPSTTRAGGHPDLETQFGVENRLFQKTQSACNCQDAKDAAIHLPAGLIGSPTNLPQCSIAEFSSDTCPIDSQIGIAHVVAGYPGFETPFNSAIYNLIPPPDVAGLLGFKVAVFDSPQFELVSARTGSDFGLDVTATSIFHGLFVPLISLQQDTWGVPADPIHNPLRINPKTLPGFQTGESWYFGGVCDANEIPSTKDPNTIVKPCGGGIPPAASNSPLTPFLQNPTTCDTPLSSSLDVLSYDGGTDHADYPWPQMTGCDQLSFNPSLFAQPTTIASDSPSGIDVNLTIPQQQSPTVPSPSELRAATVTLPAGFSINSSAAEGKSSCTDLAAKIGTGSLEAANCPEFSKVGSLTIDSSALPGPLPGYVYLGQPLPGNRYRIFLVADGFATHVKLPGTVTPDPHTGQLVITFTNLPEAPLTSFNMHFFGSERGVLATPTQCGTYPVTSIFTPWDAALPAQTSTQFFTIDEGPGGSACPNGPRPFSPGFQASSAENTAGSHTSFSLELTRNDGEQNLNDLSVTTPPGFAATLKGVPYCPEAAIAAAAAPGYSGLSEQVNSSCPVASQVGDAIAAAGAGAHPLYVAGKVYLAGPYKGAPLSLVVITPAVSGPYDLGNVVIRTALHVDPSTAQVTAVSDQLPEILEGIPLRLRSVMVNLNRPGFSLNPTNCDPLSTIAKVSGNEGATARLSSPFQVANCASLPFGPKLDISLKGGTRRTQNPALKAVLTANPGEANISRAQVTLPHAEFLDNAHIQTICTRVQFAEGATPGEKCPAASIYGFAKAATPLLDKPLAGPVYLRTSSNKLPDLVATLNGQISVALVGKIDTGKDGGIRNTFEMVPDAPVSKFALEMKGGSKGLLENSENICAKPQHAIVDLTAQSGKVEEFHPLIANSCGAKARHKRRHLSHAGAVR